MCIWLTHTRMPSILCLVKLSQVESEVVNSSAALADRFFFGLLTFMDEFDRNCMQVRKRVPTKFFEHVGALAGGSPKSLWPQWSLALVIFPSSKASARRQLRGCTSKRMLQKIWMDLFLLTTYSDQWLQLFKKHQRNKWWPSPSAVGFSFMPDLRLWVA